jgi:hypothetical protein
VTVGEGEPVGVAENVGTEVMDEDIESAGAKVKGAAVGTCSSVGALVDVGAKLKGAGVPGLSPWGNSVLLLLSPGTAVALAIMVSLYGDAVVLSCCPISSHNSGTNSQARGEVASASKTCSGVTVEFAAESAVSLLLEVSLSTVPIKIPPGHASGIK